MTTLSGRWEDTSVANTPMLEKLDTHPPEFLFLQESELQPQAPILPEILPQPQLSQSELIAMRSAWAKIDSMRLAIETQGEMLVNVTSLMHKAEEEVNNLKRSASREDSTPEAE
jgi:hypothetical protein